MTRVLAYHTALEFHGRAYSVFEEIQYLTGRATWPVTIVPKVACVPVRSSGMYPMSLCYGPRLQPSRKVLVDDFDIHPSVRNYSDLVQAE